jgi:hypothetical protein
LRTIHYLLSLTIDIIANDSRVLPCANWPGRVVYANEFVNCACNPPCAIWHICDNQRGRYDHNDYDGYSSSNDGEGDLIPNNQTKTGTTVTKLRENGPADLLLPTPGAIVHKQQLYFGDTPNQAHLSYQRIAKTSAVARSISVRVHFKAVNNFIDIPMWSDYIPEETIGGEIREWIHFKLSEYLRTADSIPRFALTLKLPRGNFEELAGNWAHGTPLPSMLTFRQLASLHGTRNFMIEFDLGQIEGGVGMPWHNEGNAEKNPMPENRLCKEDMDKYYYARKYLLAGGVDEEDDENWEQTCLSESSEHKARHQHFYMTAEQYSYWPTAETMRRAICETVPPPRWVSIDSDVDLQLCKFSYQPIPEIEKLYKQHNARLTHMGFLPLLQVKIESLLRPYNTHVDKKLLRRIGGGNVLSRHQDTQLQKCVYGIYQDLTDRNNDSMAWLLQRFSNTNYYKLPYEPGQLPDTTKKFAALRAYGMDSYRAERLVIWIREYLLRVELQPTYVQEYKNAKMQAELAASMYPCVWNSLGFIHRKIKKLQKAEAKVVDLVDNDELNFDSDSEYDVTEYDVTTETSIQTAPPPATPVAPILPPPATSVAPLPPPATTPSTTLNSAPPHRKEYRSDRREYRRDRSEYQNDCSRDRRSRSPDRNDYNRGRRGSSPDRRSRGQDRRSRSRDRGSHGQYRESRNQNRRENDRDRLDEVVE